VPRPTTTPRNPPAPRRATFPAPAPLTDGERALLALFNQHPEVKIEAKTGNFGPLEIEPLEIRPLRSETDQ
jgi:hypothetical protein